MPPAVRERIERYKAPEAQRASLLANLLLRRALADLGKENLFSLLRTAPSGKPTVEGIHFSLSHCRGASLCCVSDAEVGADIETVRVFPKEFAASFLDPKSSEVFLRLKEKENDAFLTRQWTQKESYLKLTGQGIRTKLSRLAPEERDGGIVLCDAFIESLFIKNMFWLSIASYQKREAAEVRMFSYAQLAEMRT